MADMLQRVSKRTKSQHTSDEKLAQRAQELNTQYLENKAQVGSIRWVSNQNTRWGSTSIATGDIRISDRLQKVPGMCWIRSLFMNSRIPLFPGTRKSFGIGQIGRQKQSALKAI